MARKEIIEEDDQEGGLEKTVVETEDVNQRPFYIANQLSSDRRSDEVYRLAKSFANKRNVVLLGEPGVGKNMLVKLFAYLAHPDKELTRVVCNKTTEVGDILGEVGVEPETVLDEKGKPIGVAPKTGNVQLAAGGETLFKEGGILHLDEVVRLRDQGALNDILDYHEWTCGREHFNFADGAMLVSSYNPGEGSIQRDLEKAFGDRFEYRSFRSLPEDLQVRIGMVVSGFASEDEIIDDKVEERAIVFNEKETKSGKKKIVPFRYKRKGKKFVPLTGKGKEVDENDPKLRKYLCYVGNPSAEPEFNETAYENLDEDRKTELHNAYNFVKSYVTFGNELASFLKTGQMEGETHLQGSGPPAFADLIEPPSPRAIIEVAEHYKDMLQEGADYQEILNEASEAFIERFCRGESEDKVVDFSDSSGTHPINLKEYLKQILSDKRVELDGSEYVMYSTGEWADSG